MQPTLIRMIAIATMISPMLFCHPGFATAAGPDSSEDKRFNQEILDILKDEGKIDTEEYEELKEKEEKEWYQAYTVKYSNGLQLNRNDGMIKIKLGGRIQADFATIHPSYGLEAAVPGGDGAGVEFRRARLYMAGELYKRIIFKAQYDFVPDPTQFKDVYIGMKGLGPMGTVRVGHVKEPFGLEELTSSKHITFMERSLGAIFDSDRNFGIVAMNAVLDERLTYALGVFAPSDNAGNYFNNAHDVNLTGRFTGLPWMNDDGSHYLHLGVGFSYQFRDGMDVSYSQRPESHLAQKYVSTGSLPNYGNALLGAELAWVAGPVSLQSEIKATWLALAPNADRVATWSAYAQLSYFLTGEHRVYKKSGAIFTRVNPRKPFNPAKGQWGAWEIAARYSYVDLNDSNGGNTINGGRQQDFTVGLNWHLYSNVKLLTNYVHADVKDTGVSRGGTPALPANQSGDADIFQMRLQLEF